MSCKKHSFAHDWLAEHVKTGPDASALITPSQSFSFAALQGELQRMATALQGQGIPFGGVVALALHERASTVLLVLALQKLGCIPLVLNPDLPAEQRAHLLATANAPILIGEATDDALPPSLHQFSLEQLYGANTNAALGDAPAALVDVERPALILATSGSTAMPKGVMLSADNLIASASAVRQRIGLKSGDRWLCCLPLYHIGGLAILFRTLQAAATLVLHERFNAEAVWRELNAGGITHLSLVPAMLAQLLDVAQAEPLPSELRAVIIGGSAIDTRLVDRARAQGWPLCLSYGMTETASQLATDCAPRGGQRSVGLPLAGVEIQAPACAENRPDVRLRIKGPMVMMGYANPGLEPGHGLNEGWLETQDLACVDVQGHLHIMGRADTVIISAGENIQPQQVEDLLLACDGVDEVGVVGRADAEWGEIVVAVYCGSIGPEDFEHWCRDQLPRHLRPREFIQVDAMPHTALDKLDRRALRQMIQA